MRKPPSSLRTLTRQRVKLAKGSRLKHTSSPRLPGSQNGLLPLRPPPGQPLRQQGRQTRLLRLRHDERAAAERLRGLQGGVRRHLRRGALHLRVAVGEQRQAAGGRVGADGGTGQERRPASGGEVGALLHPDLQERAAGQGGGQH
eukprot:scaffold7638_cov131-Isochrysis_galbana.AAC.8